MLKQIARTLWTKSPRDYWRRLRGGAAGAAESYWSFGKHAQWNRLPYYLQLFEAACRKSGRELHFPGARVLEIGAGPALGLIPFAIMGGARSCAIVDPGYREVRGTPGFTNEYLLPLYQTQKFLVGDAGPATFDEFLKRIDAIDVRVSGLEDAGAIGEPFELVLSKSCLAEIADVKRAAQACQALSAPGSLHLHYIGLAMYYERDRLGSPFGETYQHSRAENPEYLQNPGGVINLLRWTDYVEMFRGLFSNVLFLPLEDHAGRLDLAHRHADWSAYPETSLSVANGLLLAVR